MPGHVCSGNGLLLQFGRLSLWQSSTARIFTTQQTRLASHASQGVANRAKQGPGKRLGAKKGDSELVVPGNIIFRQRGSHWHPGENCVMGRDHTISSLVKGYVRYYRDPSRHKTRKYVGVVFEKEQTLPRHPSAPRQRRLGMEARLMTEESGQDQTLGIAEQIQQAIQFGVGRRLRFSQNPDTAVREGYQVRESYRSIGRTPEREGVSQRIAVLTKHHQRQGLRQKINERKLGRKKRRDRS